MSSQAYISAWLADYCGFVSCLWPLLAAILVVLVLCTMVVLTVVWQAAKAGE